MISIPTGAYRLHFSANPKAQAVTDEKHLQEIEAQTNNSQKRTINWLISLATLLVLSVALNLWLFLTPSTTEPQPNPVQNHPLWQELNQSNKPTVIVLGDRFMFWENDPLTDRNRLTLDLSINNSDDLAAYLTQYPERYKVTRELAVGYLEQSAAFSLKNIIPLFKEKSQIKFKMSSQLNADDMANYNIIYIGPYQYMGMLSIYFRGSAYQINPFGKQLIHKESHVTYFSRGNTLKDYTDHGLFAKFDGANNNTYYIISGYSDSSILHMAQYLTDIKELNAANFDNYMSQDSSHLSNFEMIFKVPSIERIGFNAELIDQGAVDEHAIWSGEKP